MADATKPSYDSFSSYNDLSTYIESTPKWVNADPKMKFKILEAAKQEYMGQKISKVPPSEVLEAQQQKDPTRGWASQFRSYMLDGVKKYGDPAGIEPLLSMLPDSRTQLAIDATMAIPAVGEAVEGAETVGAFKNALGPGADVLQLGENALSRGINNLPRIVRPFARAGARMAPPTIAGAIGGATEGRPKAGAAQGFSEGLISEAASGIFHRGRETIRKLDFEALSGWVEKHMGNAAGFGDSIAEFNKKITGGEAMNEITEEGDRLVDEISKPPKTKAVKKSSGGKLQPGIHAHTGKPLNYAATGAPTNQNQFEITVDPDKYLGNPKIPDKIMSRMGFDPKDMIKTQKVDFRTAIQSMKGLEEVGWDFLGDPKMSYEGQLARSMSIQMEESLAEQIQQNVGKKQAQEFLTNRYRYHAGKTITGLLKEARIKGGSWADLQELASGKYLEPLQTNLGIDSKAITGAKDAKQLLDVLYRGGSEDTSKRAFKAAADQAGQFAPYVRMHAKFFPTMGVHPKLAFHSGALPYDLGRNKAMTAVLTLGPYRAIQFAKDYFESQDQGSVTDMQGQLPDTSVVAQ